MPVRTSIFALITFHVGVLLGVACSSRNECVTCQHEKCSDLLDICNQNSDCACVADCTARMGLPGVDECLSSCGVTERPPLFVPVEECMILTCPDSDECSAPADSGDIGDGDGGTTGIEGGGTLADCSFDADLSFDPDGEFLQLQSADESVCVRLERRNDGPGDLANTKWTLIEMYVGPLGEVALVDDSSDMCWYSSHHNFTDWAHVWTGTTHHDLKLIEDGHGGPRTYELYTFAGDAIDADACAPLADGTNPIGSVVELYPFN